MSFSFSLYSHPQKLLFDHLKNVGVLSREILSSKCFKDSEMKTIFTDVAYLIGICHDFGKATTFFQAKLQDNSKQTKKARHGEISAFFGYLVVREYLDKRSLIEKYWYLPAIAWVVIKQHHGDIHNLYGDSAEYERVDLKNILLQANDILKNNAEEVILIYKHLLIELGVFMDLEDFLIGVLSSEEKMHSILKEIKRYFKRMWRESKIDYYFYILFFYSVLLDSDKLDASETSIPTRDYEKLTPDLVDKYKLKKFANKPLKKVDKIREKAYTEVINKVDSLDLEKDRILSITLPTGAGKTLTSISFALKLRARIKREYGFTPKVIYSLPFLSIIDQNASVIEDMLRLVYGYTDIPTNLFLKHHHLAEIQYRVSENGEDNIVYDINKSLLLTEGWYSDFIITTFVQFFHSLITNRNRAARKFHNIINSIIILDEVQAFPVKYWEFFRNILKFLAERFNTWIIFMSATQPLIFDRDEITELVDNHARYFEKFDRYTVHVNLSEIYLDDFVDSLLREIPTASTKDYMIVLNTISSAKKVYEKLKKELSLKMNLNPNNCPDDDGICNLGSVELIYLSTHVLPKDRLNRIKRIKTRNKKQKIIVTTQLIEAGVDISVDVIYRDLAPFDSIVQTAGRCNREGNSIQKGQIKVICIKDKRTNRAYWEYIYDPILIYATKDVLSRCQNFSEREFVFASTQHYYHQIKKRKSQDTKVLESILGLYFSEIHKEFRLIEEKVPRIQIFIEIDIDAINVRKTFEEILKTKDKLARKREIIKIKKVLNECTIQIGLVKKYVPIMYTLPQLDGLELFRYVSYETIEKGKWYKKDVGFDPPEEVESVL